MHLAIMILATVAGLLALLAFVPQVPDKPALAVSALLLAIAVLLIGGR